MCAQILVLPANLAYRMNSTSLTQEPLVNLCFGEHLQIFDCQTYNLDSYSQQGEAINAQTVAPLLYCMKSVLFLAIIIL